MSDLLGFTAIVVCMLVCYLLGRGHGRGFHTKHVPGECKHRIF